MTSTYVRVMTGSVITAPPIRKRWVYLTVGSLIASAALLSRAETVTLFGQPAGFAAGLAILAGFVATKSMSLTPWALVCAALVLYGVEHSIERPLAPLAGAQFAILGASAVVGVLQMKIKLVGGSDASRPTRTRWGSVVVTTTVCLVVLALSRPDVVLMEWIRQDAPADAEPLFARSDYGPVLRMGRLQDPMITESSGLVASHSMPGAFWTHNDSGNDPNIYCIKASGVACGTWSVAGAVNRDWEDIAIGPGANPQVRTLYIGDIGDNTRVEEAVTVYRVAEPNLAGDVSVTATTSLAEPLTFRYPDGAHDAETLLVHPLTGDLYIVTKEHVSGVYKAAAPFTSSSTTVLEKVGKFSIFANFADVTGGDISPNGRRVAIATYGGWYEFKLSRVPESSVSTDFEAIWTAKPSLIGANAVAQWEAIAYRSDGRALLMTSEGSRSAIYRATRW